MYEYKKGDKAICKCGHQITHSGEYWVHDGQLKPRHPGFPAVIKPVILENFTDNGAHSHWSVINAVTGKIIVVDILDIKNCPLYIDYKKSCKALKERDKELKYNKASKADRQKTPAVPIFTKIERRVYMLKVKLHSNQQDAAEATDNTIKQLPGNGYLLRAREGEIFFDEEGFATLQADNLGFMKAVLIKQGYVKEIKDIYQGGRADV